jgi:hypothetical protein
MYVSGDQNHQLISLIDALLAIADTLKADG